MPKGKDKSRAYFVAPPPPVGVVACPSINEDESIQSVLWRFSRANGVTILAAARALGLTYPGGQVSAAYPIRPHDSTPTDLVDHLRGAFLRDHADRGFRVIANDSMRTLAHRELVRGGDSLVLPVLLGRAPGLLARLLEVRLRVRLPEARMPTIGSLPRLLTRSREGKEG